MIDERSLLFRNYSAQSRNVHILALFGEKSLQNAHGLSCTLRFFIDFSPNIIQNLNVTRVFVFAVNSYIISSPREIEKWVHFRVFCLF